MTFTVLMRRSSVPGHAPTTTQLNLGEISVNTYDGVVYFMQSNGTANSIVALSPKAATANSLANTVTISLGGDATGSTSFNGTTNVTITTTLANVNNNIGTFGTTTTVPTITLNAKGLITSVTNSAIAFPVISVGGSTGAVTGGTFTTAVSFTGQTIAITQPAGDNSTNVATTEFVTNTAGNYVPITGATMTGDLYVANTAANANSGPTRFRVDAYVGNTVSSRVSLVANPGGGTAIDYFGSSPAAFQSFSNLNSNSLLWIVYFNDSPAGGNNTGENYSIHPYDDSGNALPVAQTIYRSNSVTVFGNTIVTVTQPTSDNTTNVATTAFVKSTQASYLPLAGGTLTGALTLSPSSGVYPIQIVANTNGVIPTAVQSTANSAGLVTGWNYAGGNQEVDFFNPYLLNGGSGGFQFFQQISNTAVTPVLRVFGNGTSVVANLMSQVNFSTANATGTISFGTFNGTTITTPGVQSYSNSTVILASNTTITPSGLTSIDLNVDATIMGNTSAAILNLNANAANYRVIEGDTSGSIRIRFGISNAAETGSNIGSNFFVSTYSDTGVFLQNALTVYRSNGLAAFANTVTTVTQPAADNSTNVATTAFVQNTVGNYMPIAGGTFTGHVYTSNGTALTVGGALFALTTINALGQGAVTGGLYNLAPAANTINYTQVNVYDGNTGGYYINNAGGVNRWSFITSAAVGNATTNANSGSDLTITAWTGAGNPPATATNVLTLYRGNAVAVFSNTVVTVTQPTVDNTTNVATTAFVHSAFAAGGTIINSVTINANLAVTNTISVTSAVNTTSQYLFQNTGVNRWSIGTVTNETGSNLGSNLQIVPYTDAGGASTAAMTIYRSNALVAHSGTITTITQPLTDATSNVATTAFVKSANATQISRYVTGTVPPTSGSYSYTTVNSTLPTTTGWGTLWTNSITPSSTSSKIKIQFTCTVAGAAAKNVYLLLTRGATIIGMSSVTIAGTGNTSQPLSLLVFDSPGVTTSTTYTCYYAGSVASSLTYINQLSGGNFSSAMTSAYYLQDI